MKVPFWQLVRVRRPRTLSYPLTSWHAVCYLFNIIIKLLIYYGGTLLFIYLTQPAPSRQEEPALPPVGAPLSPLLLASGPNSASAKKSAFSYFQTPTPGPSRPPFPSLTFFLTFLDKGRKLC